MRLSDFDYSLPASMIAQYPLQQRDQAKLLVVNRRTKSFRDSVFRDLNLQLPNRSLLVINNSKVVPARLFGHKRKTGARIEVFLLKKVNRPATYEVLLRPLKRLKAGDRIRFDHPGLEAEVLDTEQRLIRFNGRGLSAMLAQAGHMPLPPYIRRPDEPLDRQMYQTVYARYPGSVAAPTAGLHFTRELLQLLKKKGHQIETVTLHVNYGTFKPVEEEDIRKHPIHQEEFSISAATIKRLQAARRQGRKIIAIGTTACRVLETWASQNRCRGGTDLFIYPGYRFRMVDGLITNFHLPRSTLLMLVYAFGSPGLIQRAYRHAIRSGYRFYSYGDAMFIR